jgi:hypothetical protein
LGVETKERSIRKNNNKARYCVHGDQQVAGVEYFESYAPVVAWSSVRIMFILRLIAKLEVI